MSEGGDQQRSLPPESKGPGTFEIRGVKGLWWEGTAKYRAILEFLPACDCNFLMTCYTSYAGCAADWRRGLAPSELDELAALAARGRKLGVDVCVAVNPAIWSSPPLAYADPEDGARLLQMFTALSDRGLRSFCVCLDDIGRELGPEDAKRYGTLAAAQADFVNRLWRGLRARRADARLLFCPSAYTSEDMRAHPDYIRAIGARIDPGVDFFWTGPVVWSPSIADADADEVAAWCGRKVVIWDNYPANDNWNWRPFLAPVRNRSRTLPAHAKGLVANLMLQERASRVPLFTLGEYFRDPVGYDPDAALERALDAVGGGRGAPKPPDGEGGSGPGAGVATGGRSHLVDALRPLAGIYGKYFYDDPRFADPVNPATVEEARELSATLRAARDILRGTALDADLAPQIEADLAYLRTMAGSGSGLPAAIVRGPAGSSPGSGAEAPSHDDDPGGVELSAADFAGGGRMRGAVVGTRHPPSPTGLRRDLDEAPNGAESGAVSLPRDCNAVFAAPTGAFMMTAAFYLQTPPEGVRWLEIEGRQAAVDRDRKGRPRCEISIDVNGKDAHRGASRFPEDGWGALRFEIPAGTLKAGKNLINVWNLEGRGTLGRPPWFAIRRARVVLRAGMPRVEVLAPAAGATLEAGKPFELKWIVRGGPPADYPRPPVGRAEPWRTVLYVWQPGAPGFAGEKTPVVDNLPFDPDRETAYAWNMPASAARDVDTYVTVRIERWVRDDPSLNRQFLASGDSAVFRIR